MNTIFTTFFFALLGISISSCEKRMKRQIWAPPVPPSGSDLFWAGHSPDYHNTEDFFPQPGGWGAPQGFGQPFQSINNFQPGWNNDNSMSRQNSQNSDRRKNNNNIRQNEKQRKRQNQSQNQSRRRTTTTENLGPITTTQRTIHYAPQNCECPMTQQFNPVCGTDGNTYRNEGLLNCYVRCGTNVARKRLGTC